MSNNQLLQFTLSLIACAIIVMVLCSMPLGCNTPSEPAEMIDIADDTKQVIYRRVRASSSDFTVVTFEHEGWRYTVAVDYKTGIELLNKQKIEEDE